MSESSVRERYAAGAQQLEVALCCPVDYDKKYLEIIPDEVIERDYGCGDPSKYVHEGETVLDLGSGTGKICFIASQVVGKTGKVIGVDMTDAMLEVAVRNAPIVAEKVGYSNVEFRKGRIQDLALDLEQLETWLKDQPVDDANGFLALEEKTEQLREAQSLIKSDSIDVVVSNCVLNLVGNDARTQLFSEIYRVLNNGGRAVISDIVCDEDVPDGMQKDDELWSGCISGAFREDGFLEAFEDAGFHGVEIVKFDKEPWQTVEGIEFRSMTVVAYKGKEGPCIEKNQAVIYKGPFKSVVDDDGHPMIRGKRYAVCEKTYNLYKRAPYADMFEFVDPHTEVTTEKPFDCTSTRLRDARETKGQDYTATIQIGSNSCCSPEDGSDGSCC